MTVASINGMAERFRTQLASTSYVELPGCHDVLSAMLLERAGFGAVFMSGYGVAASLLGNPDIGLTTLTETSSMARSVVSRVGLPVVVDADNGYGNEDNVIRTINELESAGAAALVIEDQVLPKRCGHTADKKILPLPLYMKKLEAALKARRTPLVIIARTDSRDLDDAVHRAQTFHAAGADATIVDGLRSLDDMRRVTAEIPGPKQINLIYGGVTPILPAAQLHELGFNIILYSTPTLYVAVRAIEAAVALLRETHDLSSIASASVAFSDFQSFMEARYAALVGQSGGRP